MKILNAAQIKALDAFTIKHEGIKSIDLMERASQVFVRWFTRKFAAEENEVIVFVGPGNNGGDGLAVARLLYFKFYNIKIYRCIIGENTSLDFEINLKNLPKRNAIPLIEINENAPFPEFKKPAIVIDAIFGSGLNRPLEGYWKILVEHLNEQAETLVSIDIPSGLFADKHSSGVSIQADYTLSFELPKLAFLFPENLQRVGKWQFQSIRLNPDFIKKCETPFHFVDLEMVKAMIKKRQKFDHKGTFGHALLIAGSYGKVGAAVLSAKAALRSGAGLVTIHAPKCAYPILQISAPEAMVSVDSSEKEISELPKLEVYKAVGIGCGIGTNSLTVKCLSSVISSFRKPIIFDADALNILANNPDWFSDLPKNSILTPHPKEFERLFGKTQNNFQRNELQRKKAQELNVFIILKGAHTCIATPDGTCFFNTTGNPGMATGGSGDVLTGLLTGLLAQGYSAGEAAILGVYLHGLAGDLAIRDEQSKASLLAGDLIEYFGKAFKVIKD